MKDTHRNRTSDATTEPGHGRTPHDAATAHATSATSATTDPTTAHSAPPATDAPGGRVPRPGTGPDAATAAGRPTGPVPPPPHRAPSPRRPGSTPRGPGAGPGRGAARTRPGGPSTTTRTTPGRPLPTGPSLDGSTASAATAAAAASAAARLPTVGAQRRARERRPHLWFARQLLLTLSGQSPVHALLGHALPVAYDRLVELAPQTPLRPLTAGGRRAPLPALHECGLCRPRTGVIEAFARIASGDRLRALAFRLELGADTRWRCATFDLGPTPAPWVPAPRCQGAELRPPWAAAP
ncbi:Rv3235 family protein [Streptomyces sp. NPDC101150]|uniref:Rv3235 family protein n=1 Tax=Streptomyces sp. NPDC101150 TaxID=3366114 RepID=UPI0037FCC350